MSERKSGSNQFYEIQVLHTAGGVPQTSRLGYDPEKGPKQEEVFDHARTIRAEGLVRSMSAIELDKIEKIEVVRTDVSWVEHDVTPDERVKVTTRIETITRF